MGTSLVKRGAGIEGAFLSAVARVRVTTTAPEEQRLRAGVRLPDGVPGPALHSPALWHTSVSLSIK